MEVVLSLSSATVRPAPRVLLADDDDLVRGMLASLLARDGLDVTACVDGLDAQRAVELHAASFDLLVLDHDMPGLTGLGLVARLRRRGLSVPVLLVTGSVDATIEDWATSLGVTRVLWKPFLPSVFRTEIRAVLDRFAAR